MRNDKPQLDGTETVIKYGDGVDLILGKGITQGDEEVVRRKVDQRIKEERELKEQFPEAGYTLEVMFGSNFSTMRPSKGAISFWQRGAIGGAGDTKLYLCPGQKFKVNECNSFIPPVSLGWEMVICPSCGVAWHHTKVDGEIFAILGIGGWADLVLHYFVQMGMDADIRVKYHPTDIRSMAVKEQERQRGGELLEGARSKRAVLEHPMRDIIRDASTGADLRSCILSRLKA
jgi:hypothetical protein